MSETREQKAHRRLEIEESIRAKCAANVDQISREFKIDLQSLSDDKLLRLNEGVGDEGCRRGWSEYWQEGL